MSQIGGRELYVELLRSLTSWDSEGRRERGKKGRREEMSSQDCMVPRNF
jgi:hypothetical protein